MAGRGRRKGTPKTGGRKKGTPNKPTVDFVAMADAHGVHPGELMCRVIKGERIMALAYANKETGEFVEHPIMPTLDQMISADKELAQYVYPKRKAMEHSGSLGTYQLTKEQRDAAVRAAINADT